MQNFRKQKQNQTEIPNLSQMNDNYPKNANNVKNANNASNASRAFGKDITNQVKYLECVEKSNGCINLDGDKPHINSLQNNLVNIKATYRGLRGKNQSMDDNLLKNFVSKNVRTSNFDFTKEKPSYPLNPHEHNNICNKIKAKREETKLKDYKMEVVSKVNRQLKNVSKDNTLLSVGVPINKINNNYNERARTKQEIKLLPRSIGVNSDNNQNSSNFNSNYNNHQFFYNKNEQIPISSDVYMRTVSPMEEDLISLNQMTNDPNQTVSTQPHEEYLDEIYTNLLQEELSDPISDYMQFQDHINPKMRIILIEWIIDVSIKFKLRQNTLFLAVHLIDRYLTLRKITRDRYQLLGACCMLVACKFEEIYFPELRDIIYICDKAYSGQDIIKMESEILRALDYKIVPVSPSRFLQIISAQLKLSEFDNSLCNLMLELVIFDYDMVTVLPSLIACTSVYIAFKIKKISSDECNRLLERYYNIFLLDIFPESQIKECAQSICALLDKINLSCFRKIKEKYSKKEFCEVANFYYL